jgi:hypothetical protein
MIRKLQSFQVSHCPHTSVFAVLVPLSARCLRRHLKTCSLDKDRAFAFSRKTSYGGADTRICPWIDDSFEVDGHATVRVSVGYEETPAGAERKVKALLCFFDEARAAAAAAVDDASASDASDSEQ